MEGGYVNEEDSDAIMGVESPAITNSNSNPAKLQNPILATTTTSATLEQPPSSSSSSPLSQVQVNPTTSTSTTNVPTASSQFDGFMQKLRNLNLKDNKFKERFYIEYYAKDKLLGGQLKTKNGQKYVFNGPPSGVFVSKACATFTALIAVLVIIFTILITYFITASTVSSPSCTNGNSILEENTSLHKENAYSSNTQPVNATQVATASMFGMPLDRSKASDSSASSFGPTAGDIPPDTDLFVEESKFINRKLQLYEGWLPEHYIITIEPNVATSSNNGSLSLKIRRDPKSPSLEPIVLDVHNITISNVRLVRSLPTTATTQGYHDDSEIEYDGEYSAENTTFVITLPKYLADVKKLQLVVSMDFVSQLTDTLQGIYKTSYKSLRNERTKQEWMVSTQFSPIEARRAFPCYDRPDKKANFTISIIRENIKSMALSNMPVYHSSPYRPGYTKDDFLTTPKMPTYLVAFIVSNLVKSNYSDNDANLVPRVEIWTRPENSEMTNFAYTMVRKFLPFFEEYFGMKYHLPKLDLVTVPDFGFGAMENWGLITFRDSALLVPADLEKTSSSDHIEFVASIIAHELAHQWFGNLVTPKWWDDIWLKESFATYMSYIAVNAAHPEYKIFDTFTVYEFSSAMHYDADNSSHAISFDVKSTNDIRIIFDSITYSKGTILLRMLSSIVGDEAFRSATQDLLKSFAYENADRNDLWEFMTRHGHNKRTLPQDMHVKEIMDSWINKPGYPVVNVKRNGTDLILTQERYTLPTKNTSDESRWMIPITFETDELRMGDNIPTHWIGQHEEGIVINDVFTKENNTGNWVYLNLNRQSYYRVNYDVASWLALQKNFSSLPSITRAQLLDDSLHLAQAEYLTYDIPLTFLMELFIAIDDELLWSAANQGLNYLIHMLQREPAYETFRAFMKFIVGPAFKHYGLNEPDNESHLQMQHRATVVRLACKFNIDRCTMGAHLKYRNWMTDPKQNPIKPNLKSTIYCTALAEGSFQEWYFAYDQYNLTTSASEKEQILSALGCTTKPWLLSKYLNMTISPNSTILKQDGVRAFHAVALNPVGYEIAFDFLQTNIKEIAEYYGDGFSTLSNMIKGITTYMNKDYHKDQLQQFGNRARKLGLNSVDSAIALAMEKVNNNIYWRSRSYYNLKSFLETIVSDVRINIF